MMNIKMILTTLLTFALSSGISAQDMAEKLYTVTVDDFDQLHVNNNIEVDYKCNADSAGIAVFTATPDKASLLLFSNNGRGRLAIQSSVDCPDCTSLPRVTVYSSGLKKALNSGDSLLRVTGATSPDKFTAVLIGNGRLAVHDIEAPQVDASLRSGNGQLIISGRCTSANLKLVGTGTILADRLKAVNGKASVVGTGMIGCDFSESLTVMGMGSGSVCYRTTPPTIKSRGVGIKHGLLSETTGQ